MSITLYIQKVIGFSITYYLGGVFITLVIIKLQKLFVKTRDKSLKPEYVYEYDETLIVKNEVLEKPKEIVTSQCMAIILFSKPFEYVTPTQFKSSVIKQVKKASVGPYVLEKLHGHFLRASLGIKKESPLKGNFFSEAIFEFKPPYVLSRATTSLLTSTSWQLLKKTAAVPNKRAEQPNIAPICRSTIKMISTKEKCWVLRIDLGSGVILHLKIGTLIEEITSKIIDKDEQSIRVYCLLGEIWDQIKNTQFPLELLTVSKQNFTMQSIANMLFNYIRQSTLIDAMNIPAAKIKITLNTYEIKHGLRNPETKLICRTLRKENIMDNQFCHELEQLLSFTDFWNIPILKPPKTNVFSPQKIPLAGPRDNLINKIILNIDKKGFLYHDPKKLLETNIFDDRDDDGVKELPHDLYQESKFVQQPDPNNQVELEDEKLSLFGQDSKYTCINHLTSEPSENDDSDINELCFNGPNAAASSRHDAGYEKFLEQAAELRITEEEEPNISDSKAARMRLAAHRLAKTLGWDWDGTRVEPEDGNNWNN
ncbi:hypothetical protein G9A89_007680 [Geosiphon pyriformis]|nr:hypothetical protein G9A89_007680 [Geosiphon pyriformis]